MPARFFKAIQRIKNVGYLQELDDDSQRTPCLLIDQSGPGESRCFDFGGGVATVLTYLWIACTKPVRISAFGTLRLVNTSVAVDWWANDLNTIYRADPDLEFEYGEVLNHRVAQGLFVRPSYPIQGRLIGRVFKDFPQGLLVGAQMNTVLEIYDDLGQLHETELQFMVERHTLRGMCRHSTLYDTPRGQRAQTQSVSAKTGSVEMDIKTNEGEV